MKITYLYKKHKYEMQNKLYLFNLYIIFYNFQSIHIFLIVLYTKSILISLMDPLFITITFLPLGAHKEGLEASPNNTTVGKPLVANKCIGPVSLPIA